MRQKFIVYRMDYLTRVKYPRTSLFRFKKVNDTYVLDLNDSGSRGLYLYIDKSNFDKVFANRRLQKIFEKNYLAELKDQIKKILDKED